MMYVPTPTTNSKSSQAVAGQIFFDVVSNQMKMYDGKAWVAIDPGMMEIEREIEIVCDEQEYDGLTWYTVEAQGGIFSARREWWNTAMNYARATFRNETGAWNVMDGDWLANNSKFWFKKERDRTLFVLKMS